jgi:hypothetical protein
VHILRHEARLRTRRLLLRLTQGTIAWATVAPPRGASKERPVVIYTPTHLIESSDTLGVVGITTSY